MPFDDTSPRTTDPESVVPVRNTLAALGLTPVPRDIAERHKKKMIRQYADRGVIEADRVRSGATGWWTLDFDVPISDLHHRINGTLSVRYTSDKTVMPVEIVKVAQQVGNGIKGATFSVQYFDVDPILDVTYTDALGRRHFDCLGIWDRGEVVAIASGGSDHRRSSPILLAGVAFVVAFVAAIGIVGLTTAGASGQPHARHAALTHIVI